MRGGLGKEKGWEREMERKSECEEQTERVE